MGDPVERAPCTPFRKMVGVEGHQLSANYQSGYAYSGDEDAHLRRAGHIDFGRDSTSG